MKKMLAPSLLACDFAKLREEIEMVNGSIADWFHLDIMDGVFVPNISFGFPVLETIKKYAKKPLDVHLMIVHPEKYIQKFKNAGASLLNVHYEACTHLHRAVEEIKEEGMKAGVTLNPHTPVDELKEIIHELDLVLIMSVDPGFGGQKFIEHTYKKVQSLKELILQKNSKALIEVDGGVDLNNARKLYECGVDVLVSGTAIFKSKNPVATIEKIKNI